MRRTKKYKGVALIFAIAVFFLVSILGTALLRLSINNSTHSLQELKKSQAEYISKAGLEIGLAALEKKDDKKNDLTLYDRVLENSAVEAYKLKNGFSNVNNASSQGDVIDIKSPDGKVVGKVQVIVYSITAKDGESDTISLKMLSGENKVINRKNEAERLGISKDKTGTWVFRVVAIGETLDYSKMKSQYPASRQIMTAEINMENNNILKIYSGY